MAVVADGGRLLIIRRAPGVIAAGQWCFPGGGIEPGESQQEALVREFHEELGVRIEPVEPLWTYVSPGRLQLYWWRARLCSADFHPNPAEVSEWRWSTAAQLWDEPDLLESNRAFLLFMRQTAVR